VHPRKCLPIGAAQIRLEQVARLLPRINGFLRQHVFDCFANSEDAISVRLRQFGGIRVPVKDRRAKTKRDLNERGREVRPAGTIDL
jgi:hypothetical protein